MKGANQQRRAGELPARTQMAPEKFSHVNACVKPIFNLYGECYKSQLRNWSRGL